jgi:SAM-dependent methyltransferase
MANAFHGVPDPARLAMAVKAVLKPGGRFAIVNWHAHPCEGTTILGEPRGPKTELRLTSEKTIEAVKIDGLKFSMLIEIPPNHYGAIFERSPT